MSKSLQGEIALVTGASRGIGKAIAEQLAADGATVIGTATTDKGAEAISAYLKGSGGKGMCLNVTDNESVADVIKQITADFGAVSILVNNAGITKDNLLMMMKQDQWDDVIDTNLTSVYRLSKSVVRSMMKARKVRNTACTTLSRNTIVASAMKLRRWVMPQPFCAGADSLCAASAVLACAGRSSQ